MAGSEVVAIAATRLSSKKRSRKRARAKGARHFETVFNIARRISGMESLDKLLYALVEMTSAEIDCDRSTFFLYDPSGNALEFKAFQDPSQLFAH